MWNMFKVYNKNTRATSWRHTGIFMVKLPKIPEEFRLVKHFKRDVMVVKFDTSSYDYRCNKLLVNL